MKDEQMQILLVDLVHVTEIFEHFFEDRAQDHTRRLAAYRWLGLYGAKKAHVFRKQLRVASPIPGF
jgi:hypothetical protein